jgi:hypothetical protein
MQTERYGKINRGILMFLEYGKIGKMPSLA